MATIHITDLSLRTVIGTNDWERKNKQDVIINIAIEYDAKAAAQSDDLKDTVDYKAITKKVITEVESSQYELLEKLVDRVLGIVTEDRRVQTATVRIDKPQALRFAKSVSVEMSRKREP
ncbi:MAG: dihydroneopterin aldolase [Candidatus Omnitrophota bacterium]|nr:dihydroneopterin aldolase [Candidatus Omnitrophota bacterium]MDZ4241527.1 dihydroneopterin aldolase [Candidatus Omnitrophota bacterium]